MIDKQLTGDRPLLDLHVHVGPEFIKRRYTVQTLAREAEKSNIGFAAKNHFQPTTAWIMGLKSEYSVPLIGSVVLNRGVGGINPEAVRAALSGCKSDPAQSKLEEDRIIVWMPTVHAEGHLAQFEREDVPTNWGCEPEHQQSYPEGQGLTVWDKGNPGMLSANTFAVLDSIAKRDLILATGHLTATEVDMLLREASLTGIRRMIITHPLFKATGMSVEKQVELSSIEGVYVELAYVNLNANRIPIKRYIEVIRAVGPEKVVLTSDLGRAGGESITEGWTRYLELLKGEGISDQEIVRMAVENPHKLVYEEAKS
jgi:hypothetical protein